MSIGTRIVDLDALAGARLATEPYRWGYLPVAIKPAQARALRDTFPQTEWHLRQPDDDRVADFELRCLVPMGADAVYDADSLDPAWRMFAEELLSDDYRQACSRAFRMQLDDALFELSAWRWGPDAELGPHQDMPRKVATQVFYFNEEWDTDWGGCLQILGSRSPDDVAAELPPDVGSASLIVRSDTSWHQVSPVLSDAAEERLSVIATWNSPGSESGFWKVQEDGSVVCFARGSTRLR